MTTLLSTRHLLARSETQFVHDGPSASRVSAAEIIDSRRAGVDSRGSSSRSITTQDHDCPDDAPELTQPANGAQVASPVQLRWERVRDGHRYRVTLRPANGVPIVLDTDDDRIATPLLDGTWTWTVSALGRKSSCAPKTSSTRRFTVATVCVKPSVSIGPAVARIGSGNRATFVAVADGTAPITVRWYEGAVGNRSKPAGNGAILTTPPLSSSTSYWCEATNACGSASSSSATATVNENCTGASVRTDPKNTTVAPNESATLTVSARGTQPISYQWYEGGSGDRSKPVGTNSANYSTGRLTRTTSYWVEVTNACGAAPSKSATVKVADNCTPPAITTQPSRKTIEAGETATLTVAASGSEPFTYQWYEGTSGDRGKPVGHDSATFRADKLTRTTDFWVEVSNRCGKAASNTATVRVDAAGPGCRAMTGVPRVSAIGSVTSGVPYVVYWQEVEHAAEYEIEESSTLGFDSAVSQRVNSLSASFVHETESATSMFYRVRAVNPCDGSTTAFSEPLRVAIVPPAQNSAADSDLVVPHGTRDRVSMKVTVQVDRTAATFTALTTESWSTVTPWTGAVPPDGRIVFTIFADPTKLSHGTSRLSLRVTTSGGSSARGAATQGTSTVVVPVAVTLVTPVMPATPTNGGEVWIIPAVAHADGNNSRWQSDVRIAHTYDSAVRYRLTFTPSGADLKSAMQTDVTVDRGETIALDDILGRWFGKGMAAAGATGVLEIRTLDAALGTGRTLATSRLFNATEHGSFGQFIAAVPLSKFLASSGRQTLVALSQSSRFRTNLGLVEGSGFPADVLLEAFGADGAKLLSTTLSLKPGEHRQIGSLLASNGIDAANARIDVKLLSASGSVYSYASVIDNSTGDPSFVPPADVDGESAQRYTLAGVANLDTGNGKWQTDVQLFNGAPSSVRATIDFFAQGASTPSASREVDVPAGAMLALEDVVQSLFGLTGAGGALRIGTATPSALIPAARTYHKRDGESYGQFIPAIMDADATDLDGAPLQILQVEESSRFRTNVGLTEISGNSATVEITASLPGHKTVSATRVELQPNEFRQLNSILRSMGADDAYNARVTVRVIGGSGRVGAYGSMIDNDTQDPTYVTAQ